MLVDIVLPVYRSDKKWILEAIDSVLSQTYSQWHLIIVDDASPDDTLAYIREKYQDYSDSISFVQLARNRRAAGARMEAIRQTHGDVIAFIDQDDRWHPQKLERQIARFRQEPIAQAVHTDIQHIDSRGNIISGSADRENAYRASIQYDTLECSALMRRLYFLNSIRLVSAAISRIAFEQAGGFDESLFGSEDWEFWVRFTAAGYGIAHLAEPLVERRLHQRNVSRSYSEERLLELLQASEIVSLTYPNLSDLIPSRKSLLLRQIITDHFLHNQGNLIRPRIKQLININYRSNRVVGGVFWILSFLGPLQSPLTKTALRLVRHLIPQGGSTSSNPL
jgi:glycosyltransferase involved in cell wall biosynthesis